VGGGRRGSSEGKGLSRDASRSELGQFQTLALGDEKVSKAIVLKSRHGPRQKHDLTAEAAEIDAGVDLARGGERETVDHDGMDGAAAQ
jgi:hypothetical protein